MKTIPLTQGKVALVDDEDYELVMKYKWYVLKDSNSLGTTIYARAAPWAEGRAQCVLMHRLVAGAPKGKDVDHINNDGLDNRRENLRVCTRSQNNGWQRKKPGRTSRHKGVHWDSANKKWRALIKTNQKTIHLGRFATEDEAARAYDYAAVERFGTFARLNLPLK